jgi:hypothetical protein
MTSVLILPHVASYLWIFTYLHEVQAFSSKVISHPYIIKVWRNVNKNMIHNCIFILWKDFLDEKLKPAICSMWYWLHIKSVKNLTKQECQLCTQKISIKSQVYPNSHIFSLCDFAYMYFVQCPVPNCNKFWRWDNLMSIKNDVKEGQKKKEESYWIRICNFGPLSLAQLILPFHVHTTAVWVSQVMVKNKLSVKINISHTCYKLCYIIGTEITGPHHVFLRKVWAICWQP